MRSCDIDRGCDLLSGVGSADIDREWDLLILIGILKGGAILLIPIGPHEKLLRIRRVSNPSTSIDPGSLKIGFLVLIQNAGFVRDSSTN